MAQLNRSEVDSRFKWAITDMYATDELWKSEFDRISSEIPSLASFKGTLTSENFISCLNLRDEISNVVEKLGR